MSTRDEQNLGGDGAGPSILRGRQTRRGFLGRSVALCVVGAGADGAGPSILRGRQTRRVFLGRSVALGVVGAGAAPLSLAAARAVPGAAQDAAGGEMIISLGEPDSLLSGAIQSATGGNIMRFI